MQEQFGPYRILDLLGRGGMGEVHRAFDTRRDRTVALKRLPARLSADREFRARFRREAGLAARLTSEHVVPIHDFGEFAGRLFLDMRLVDGVDAAALLARQGPFPLPRALHVVGQVAAALDAAHAEGLVHRDVKPSNVLVCDRGGQDFVYLIDFGIAQTVDSTRLTSVGAFVGSPAYMAPERFVGRTVDRGADVYALACLLFELLTGHKPFDGSGAMEQMYAHLHAPVPRISAHRPGFPPELDRVLARGLAKDPAQRYASAGAFVAAARTAGNRRLVVPAPRPAPPSRAHLDTVVPAVPPEPAEPVAPAARPARRWLTVALLLVFLVAVVGAVIGGPHEFGAYLLLLGAGAATGLVARAVTRSRSMPVWLAAVAGVDAVFAAHALALATPTDDLTHLGVVVVGTCVLVAVLTRILSSAHPRRR